MKKKNAKDRPEQPEVVSVDKINISSSMDCTGLIPSQPSDSELDSYREMYDMNEVPVHDTHSQENRTK